MTNNVQLNLNVSVLLLECDHIRSYSWVFTYLTNYVAGFYAFWEILSLEDFRIQWVHTR